MPGLEFRLARMERKMRRLHYMYIALLVLLVAPLLIGAQSPIPDVIQARAFEVIDEAGTPVVQLESNANGGRVWVWNGAGKVTTSISNTETSHGVFRLYAHRANRGLPYVTIDADETGGRISIGGVNDAIRIIDTTN